MQSCSAREERKAAGSSAGEQGRAGEQGGVKGTGQGAQGRGAGQGARQQSSSASETKLANGRRGANICQKIFQLSYDFVNIGKTNLQTAAEVRTFVEDSKNMLTFSRVYEHWQESICKRPQRDKHLSKPMITFP